MLQCKWNKGKYLKKVTKKSIEIKKKGKSIVFGGRVAGSEQPLKCQ